MENNYNGWNPDSTAGPVQDNIDGTGNANMTQNTDATENVNASEDSNTVESAYAAGGVNAAQGTYEAGNADTTGSAYTAGNVNAAESTYEAENAAEANTSQPNDAAYRQHRNPYQQYQGQQNYGTQSSAFGSNGQSYGPINYNMQGSPYGSRDAQNSTQNAQQYGTQSSTQNAQQYGAQSQAQNTQQYGAYGQTQNAQQYGAYGQAQSSQQYGQQAQRSTQYQSQQQGANYRPVTNQPKPEKKKKSGGLGNLIGKTVAVALVFGLVASLVFSGVNYGLGNVLGTDTESSSSGITTNTVSTVSTSGEASDLVDVSSIVDAVMPAIVAITNISTVTTSSMFGSYSYESQSLGSGIIIAQDDEYLYICTNNHVVTGAESLTVQFVDDSTVSAEITGTDSADDLAVIQVALSSIESDTLAAITIAQVDDSGDLSVGDGTIAIGNSLGYGQSVTTGVISALGRTITVSDETTGETTVCTNLIQTDAAINNGNSGGALLNSSGAVIGINSAKYSDTGVEGMGYAIPMSDAWSIIEAIIAGEDIPQSAYLGISGQSVSSDVSSVYGVPEGVLVVEVYEGTAAENAGIQSGDIITKFEGEELTSMDELKTILASYKEGDTVTITIARRSEGYAEMDLTVTLGASTSTD